MRGENQSGHWLRDGSPHAATNNFPVEVETFTLQPWITEKRKTNKAFRKEIPARYLGALACVAAGLLGGAGP